MDSAWHSPAAHENLIMGHNEPSGSTTSLLLYALLPSLVQRRLPKGMRPWKRAGGINPPTTKEYNPSSACHSRMSSCSTAVTHMTTPPPSYRAGTGPVVVDASDEESLSPCTRVHTAPEDTPTTRPSTAESMTHPSPSAAAVEDSKTAGGIQWRYADPGLAMLSLSAQEAVTPSPAASLIRRQYISGVTCILRGLPADLSADEELSLREALPPSLDPAARGESNVNSQHAKNSAVVIPRRHSSLLPFSRNNSTSGPPAPARPPLLQRSVAALTCALFLLAAFLLPYLQLLLRQAYQFERRHRVSDRALARGVAAADLVARRTLALAAQVCAMHDGRVGAVVKQAGFYVVQNCSAGVYDGLGEGVLALGAGGSSSAAAMAGFWAAPPPSGVMVWPQQPGQGQGQQGQQQSSRAR